MKILKLFVIVFLVLINFEAYASPKKYAPIIITKPIRLKIVNANNVSIKSNFENINENKSNFKSANIKNKNLKIEISLSKGKFNQINENIVVQGKKVKEKCIKPYPEDSKIVRKYDEFKEVKNGKLILTFISF